MLCGVVLFFVGLWRFWFCDVVLYRWLSSRAPCGMLCSCCVVWCIVARCFVLGCVVVVLCGCVACRVAVCGGVYLLWRGVASQCVVVCRVSCWYLVHSNGYVNCCVAVLRGFSLCAFVVSRVSCCCFVSWCLVLCVVALVLGWCWVTPCCVEWCRVMWCGGVSFGGPLQCVALWFVALCCIVVCWLIVVVFVLRRCFAACFVALFVVAWFFSGVLFCWFVTCASLLRRVAPCYIMCCCVLP